MDIQTRVALAELWLRDDLENIYALLFRFVGYGFRLAMSNMGWLVTQKFVILVPDPIPALQLSLFQDTADCPPFVLLCRAADVQRSGTRTGKWDSRGSVTVDFVCVCTLFGRLPEEPEELFVPGQALSLLMF